jgi:NitT/TauT family transport system permease protein
VRVADPGDLDYASVGTLLDHSVFVENGACAAGAARATNLPEPDLPAAPHAVARAITAFQTPPQRESEPWFHQTLWHSI